MIRLVSYVAYYSSPTTYGGVRFAFSYCSLVPGRVCLWSSAATAVHVQPAPNPYLNRHFFSAERVYIQVTSVDLYRPSTSGMYLSVICFSTAFFLISVHVVLYISIEREKRDSAVFSCKPAGLGLGNSIHGHCCNLIAFVAKTESVLDGGTCENLSMTSFLVRCRPDTISIRSSPTPFTAALLSCPG